MRVMLGRARARHPPIRAPSVLSCIRALCIRAPNAAILPCQKKWSACFRFGGALRSPVSQPAVVHAAHKVGACFPSSVPRSLGLHFLPPYPTPWVHRPPRPRLRFAAPQLVHALVSQHPVPCSPAALLPALHPALVQHSRLRPPRARRPRRCPATVNSERCCPLRPCVRVRAHAPAPRPARQLPSQQEHRRLGQRRPEHQARRGVRLRGSGRLQAAAHAQTHAAAPHAHAQVLEHEQVR
jgi:hypothetical protein